jgi:hypothetical protein
MKPHGLEAQELFLDLLRTQRGEGFLLSDRPAP